MFLCFSQALLVVWFGVRATITLLMVTLTWCVGCRTRGAGVFMSVAFCSIDSICRSVLLRVMMVWYYFPVPLAIFALWQKKSFWWWVCLCPWLASFLFFFFKSIFGLLVARALMDIALYLGAVFFLLPRFHWTICLMNWLTVLEGGGVLLSVVAGGTYFLLPRFCWKIWLLL